MAQINNGDSALTVRTTINASIALTESNETSLNAIKGVKTEAEINTALVDIIDNGTGSMTGAEIKAALFLEADTNNLTDTLLSKLNGIEDSATADQSGAESCL